MPVTAARIDTSTVSVAGIVQFLALSQNSSATIALTPVAVPAISPRTTSTISTAGTALYPADFQCCYLFVTTVEAPAILRSDTAPASVTVLDQFKFRSVVVQALSHHQYLLLLAQVLIIHHYRKTFSADTAPVSDVFSVPSAPRCCSACCLNHFQGSNCLAGKVQFIDLSQNSSATTALAPVAVPVVSTKDKASTISTAGTALYHSQRPEMYQHHSHRPKIIDSAPPSSSSSSERRIGCLLRVQPCTVRQDCRK